MKRTRTFSTIASLIFSSVSIFGQDYYKVAYQQDTFFSFNSTVFFDSSFKKPNSVPDGKWVILARDTIPIYVFSTYDNCVNGEFIEFWDGVVKEKGVYRMDSLWTFRFNKKDDRFKDSIWWQFVGINYDTTLNRVVGFDWARTRIYNLYYASGIKQYEKKGEQIEIWYYQNGTIKSITTKYLMDKDLIRIEQNFDSFGQLTEISTTKHSTNGKFIFSDIIEYKGNWKTKEIIDNNKRIVTIFYDFIGHEIRRTSKRKRK